MFECTSIISETHDDVSTSAASVSIKMKYAVVKTTSKSLVTWTQLSRRSTPATLQITALTTLKGPSHSRGHSEHSSGPVISKSLGSSPMREG